MRGPLEMVTVIALQFLVLGARARTASATSTETYLFRDSFAAQEGAGNVLVPVSNATGTIVTSGPDFVPGAFVTETISATACASTPTIRAWSFPATGGLRYANASPTIVTGSYSISMLMRYSPMDSGYARLIDFSNSTQDTGIYKLGDGVSFYPVGTFASGSFVSGQDVFVTITRDGATKLVSLYIDGAAAGTYSDTGDLYAPAATIVYFLMDNTTGSAAIGETDPGAIAYLQVRDTVMTPEEVAANLAAICGAVSCGDGVVAGAETCDDGNASSGDGCSSSCTVEECWQCSGAPSSCSPLDQGTACTPDGDPCTDDVCDGAGQCGVPSCASTSTSTSSTTSTSTSSSTSSSTAPPATTTSTTSLPTTTTTVPGSCAGTPAGPTFASIRCRLADLATRLAGETSLGAFQPKLAKSVETARSRTDDAQATCGQPDVKKAKKRLQQAAKALSQYAHRLGSLAARKKLDDGLRTELQDEGRTIGADVKALRAGLACPPA